LDRKIEEEKKPTTNQTTNIS